MNETLGAGLIRTIRAIWKNPRYHIDTKVKSLQIAKAEIDKFLNINKRKELK